MLAAVHIDTETEGRISPLIVQTLPKIPTDQHPGDLRILLKRIYKRVSPLLVVRLAQQWCKL